MHRKLALLFLIGSALFLIGIALGCFFAPIADRVLLYQYGGDEKIFRGKGSANMKIVIEQLCANIYPAPRDGDDCLNAVTHGIAGSFDPHTAYRDALETSEKKEREKGVLQGIGVTIVKKKYGRGFKILDLVPGGDAKGSGIQSDDEIVAVDNVPTDHFRNVYEVARAIRGTPGTHVALTLKRKDDTNIYTTLVQRKAIPRPEIEDAILQYSGKYYGFVHIHRFGEELALELGRSIRRLQANANLSGLVVSVEGNPGGSLYEVNDALDLFMDEPSFVLERSRSGIISINTDGVTTHTLGDITNGLPMLVVVDNGSASASEIFARAMQHFGRALIYGTKTFGKGTVQRVLDLPGGSEMSVTIAEYLIGTKEDWVPVQCLGVTPDILRISDGTPKEEHFECENERSLASAGPMPHPLVHPMFAAAHPKEYKVDLRMIAAYEEYRSKEEKRSSH